MHRSFFSNLSHDLQFEFCLVSWLRKKTLENTRSWLQNHGKRRRRQPQHVQIFIYRNRNHLLFEYLYFEFEPMSTQFERK